MKRALYKIMFALENSTVVNRDMMQWDEGHGNIGEECGWWIVVSSLFHKEIWVRYDMTA